MTKTFFTIEKFPGVKIDKKPMVLLPLDLWQKFEDYLEDQEALGSKKFINRLEKSRKEMRSRKIIYPFK